MDIILGFVKENMQIIIDLLILLGIVYSIHYQGKKINSLKTTIDSQSAIIESMKKYIEIIDIDQIKKYVSIKEEMEKYTVTFSEDSLFGARISTNHLSGTYQYDLEGNINFTPLSITYINIPADGYSDEYLFALDDANYYELNNNILSLYYNQSSSFLNFLRDD